MDVFSTSPHALHLDPEACPSRVDVAARGRPQTILLGLSFRAVGPWRLFYFIPADSRGMIAGLARACLRQVRFRRRARPARKSAALGASARRVVLLDDSKKRPFRLPMAAFSSSSSSGADQMSSLVGIDDPAQLVSSKGNSTDRKISSGVMADKSTQDLLKAFREIAEGEQGILEEDRESAEDGLVEPGLDFRAITESAIASMEEVLAEADRKLNARNPRDRFMELPTGVDQFFAELGLPEEIKSYNMVLHSCAVRGNYEEAMDAYRDLLNRGFDPDVYTFNSLILLQRANPGRMAVEEAARLLEEMRASAVAPNVQTYGSIIDVCSRSNCFDAIDEYLEEMVSIGLKPTPHIASSVLSGLLRRNKIDELWERYYAFCAKGALPDVVTYDILFKACARRSEVERGLALFEDLKFNGIEPTTRALNSVIYMCAFKQEFYSRGFETFTWMIDAGLRPNTHTLTALLKCCSQNKDVGNAMRVSRQFIHTYGFELTLKNYAQILDAIAESQTEEKIDVDGAKATREDRVKLAKAVMDDMKAQGIEPDVLTINKYLRVYTRARMHETAAELFEKVHADYGLQRDQFTYQYMLTMHCETPGDEEALQGFLKRMRADGYEPDILCYIEMLKRYKRQENFEGTLDTIQEMKDRRVRVPKFWMGYGRHVYKTVLEAKEAKRLGDQVEKLQKQEEPLQSYMSQNRGQPIV